MDTYSDRAHNLVELCAHARVCVCVRGGVLQLPGQMFSSGN